MLVLEISIVSTYAEIIDCFQLLRRPYRSNSQILAISIVIDSDSGHCYEHLKKSLFTMKIERVTFIRTFMFTMNFELPEMSKKWSFRFFRPNLLQLGLFHPYFVCKSSFRVISMTKMVILDQSKPISLYLKIKKSKIQKSEIRKLYVYYP